MVDYSKLSDEEINELIISKMISGGVYTDDSDDVSGKPYVSNGWNWGHGVKTNLFKDGKPFITHHNGCKLDFCNNPADAWPIIDENKISIVSAKESWLCIPYDSIVDGWTGDAAESIYSSDGVVDKNPLRCAMIVFLMMQDAKNG